MDLVVLEGLLQHNRQLDLAALVLLQRLSRLQDSVALELQPRHNHPRASVA